MGKRNVPTISDLPYLLPTLAVFFCSVTKSPPGKPLLERLGCEVLVASDGESALELHRQKGEEIDLLIEVARSTKQEHTSKQKTKEVE